MFALFLQPSITLRIPSRISINAHFEKKRPVFVDLNTPNFNVSKNDEKRFCSKDFNHIAQFPIPCNLWFLENSRS